ncbi:DUF2953 domain-containing protein [Fodinisporobacter ferrooxydans]|uniref:DUF2953 domain-containing protein n=1 Tax=Fodinisporobacter ferrooxydans TaxID=2901836 RepID=A0ABY4CH79_9BACL|nr:DUF2953 domain-containing protein [Alicyclobacillaceae bacterium MYW30-H2]
MNWLWGGIALLLALLFFCVILPVSVRVQVLKQEQLERIYVELRMLFGLIRIHHEIPFVTLKQMFRTFSFQSKIKQKILVGSTGVTNNKHKDQSMTYESHTHSSITVTVEKIKEWFQILQSVRDFLQQYNSMLLRMLKMIHIDKWHWKTAIGTGDAAEAGILCGGLWAVKSSVTGILYHFLTVKEKPVIEVYPDFHRRLLQIQFDCIIHIWVGQAIVAGVKLGYIWLRGGLPWQNIQSKG